MSEIKYIVLLFDDAMQAFEMNAKLSKLTTPTFKMQAFSRGQIMHGLHHRGQRPTHIIDYITNRDEEDFELWFEKCVMTTASRGEYIR